MRGLESQLYNKANEIQEDISMQRFDLRAKQIHLSAVQAQVSQVEFNGNFFCCFILITSCFLFQILLVNKIHYIQKQNQVNHVLASK